MGHLQPRAPRPSSCRCRGPGPPGSSEEPGTMRLIPPGVCFPQDKSVKRCVLCPLRRFLQDALNLDFMLETAYARTTGRGEGVLRGGLSRQIFKHCHPLARKLIIAPAFGILSPLLPSGGASDTHFHSGVLDPSSHFYGICSLFQVITTQIIKSHSQGIWKF